MNQKKFQHPGYAPLPYRLVLLLLLILLQACSTTPDKQPTDSGMVFFPPLPNPPRIQYLTSFSSSIDINPPDTNFESYILGKDKYKNAIPINKPYGVQMHKGKIYVVDIRGAGYDILDLENNKFSVVQGAGGGSMPKPINITIDENGYKYITDTQRNQVLVFNQHEKFVQAFGVKGQFRPGDTAIVGDKLFIADLKDNEIEVLNKNTGVLQYKIGRTGKKDGELFTPTNIKIGPDNHLYVSETGNFRVQKFTLDGQHVRNYGGIGTSIGKFARPKGIALDRDGRLLIVDSAYENVQIMDKDGKLLMFFGKPGNLPEHMNLPADIDVTYEIQYFQQYAHPDFKLEYIILLSNQFGSTKINAYGVGRMKDMDYVEETVNKGK